MQVTREISVYDIIRGVYGAAEQYARGHRSDKSAHKLAAAEALRTLLSPLLTAEIASEVKFSENARLQAIALWAAKAFIANTDLMHEDQQGGKNTKFFNRDKVGKLIPELLAAFCGAGIEDFPNETKPDNNIPKLKAKASKYSSAVIAYCDRRLAQDPLKPALTAFDQELLNHLGQIYKGLMSKNSDEKAKSKYYAELAAAVNGVLIVSPNEKEAYQQAVFPLFEKIKAVNLDQFSPFAQEFCEKLLDQLATCMQTWCDADFVNKIIGVLQAQDNPMPVSLERMRRLQGLVVNNDDKVAVAKGQAQFVMVAAREACSQYKSEDKKNSHKRPVAEFLEGILLSLDCPERIKLAAIIQFVTHTPQAEEAAIEKYSEGSHLNFGRQQAYKKLADKVVNSVSDKIVVDSIGRLVPMIIGAMQQQGVKVTGVKKSEQVSQDLVAIDKELTGLQTAAGFNPSKIEAVCLEFIGQALYHHMDKATDRHARQSKLDQLDALLAKIMAFLADNSCANLLVVFEQINFCVETSRSEGSGLRSTRLERIVTEFRDRLTACLLAVDKTSVVNDPQNFSYQTVYDLVCHEGMVTQHANQLIEAVIKEQIAKNSSDESHEGMGDSLRKNYLSEVLTRIFTREAQKSKAKFAPFNLQLFLLRNAKTISKALQFLLGDASFVGSHPYLKGYAHAFNCALLVHLDAELGKDYQAQVRTHELSALLINPELYGSRDFTRDDLPDLKVLYGKHFAIFEVGDVQARYNFACQVPVKPEISRQFDSLFNLVVSSNPFHLEYQLLNEYNQKRKQQNPPDFVTEQDVRSAENAFSLLGPVVFALQNLVDKSFLTGERDFIDACEEWKQCEGLLKKALAEKRRLGENEEQRRLKAGKKLFQYPGLCNQVVKTYLEQCTYFPAQYHGDLSPQTDDRNIGTKFPSSPLASDKFHLHLDGGVLVHQGPLRDIFKMLKTFVALPEGQRPTAVLALGDQASFNNEGDFAQYAVLDEKFELDGKNFTVRTVQQGQAKDKKNPFHYIVEQKTEHGVTEVLNLAVFNIAVNDNHPLALNKDSRDMLYHIFQHYKLSMHCASGVGRTGTMNMIRKGWQLINALSTGDLIGQAKLLNEFSELTFANDPSFASQLSKFYALQDIFAPFNIDLQQPNQAAFERAQLIAKQFPHFKTGLEKLLTGKEISEKESNACGVIFEELLHARRRIRYSVQEAIQLKSAMKEIMMYYAKQVLKMPEQELSTADGSMIISNIDTEFVQGYGLPRKALTQGVAQTMNLGFDRHQMNPFDYDAPQQPATGLGEGNELRQNMNIQQ